MRLDRANWRYYSFREQKVSRSYKNSQAWMIMPQIKEKDCGKATQCSRVSFLIVLLILWPGIGDLVSGGCVWTVKNCFFFAECVESV